MISEISKNRKIPAYPLRAKISSQSCEESVPIYRNLNRVFLQSKTCGERSRTKGFEQLFLESGMLIC
jgi:hypothetical protein